MMTTSYPNHGMHPQGMPHGQPMAGPGPNPGHPMAQMQMHPGVSGPGGPVSQAGPMMAGMQPGVGPSAHALSHLQPNQAVPAHNMFQQQQHHNMQMNPALLQQRNAQQQQAFLRHQQQQQMLAQQQNGMGMAFPQNMAGLSAQQMAALQSGQLGGQPFVNLPQHMQQQLQQRQQQAMHQQQQATSNPQAQAMAQAQAHAQAQAQAQAHAQLQQQQQAQAQHAQQQQQMQAQAIAMQHAQSQSSNHSASGTQGPPTTTQPQTGPLRPPSAIGSHQGQASPAPQPAPPQPQQQGPQPPQQAAAQSQAQSMQQQQANQQAQNQQIQQRNQALAASQQNNVQAQAAQQAARMNMMKQAVAAGQTPGGGAIIKLLNLADKMGRFHRLRQVNDIAHWKSFVAQFFSETGSFIHRLYSSYPNEKTKQFEIVYAAMPRYFYTQFNTEVENLQITIDGANEKSGPGETKVFCDRAKFIYTYSNGCQIVCSGKLTAFWANSDKMEWLQFEIEDLQQYLLRSAVEALFIQPSPSQLSQTQSPRLNKSSKQRQQQQRLVKPEPELLEPTLTKSNLPQAPVGDFGLPHALQQYLETYEIMNNMTNLMAHYQENLHLSPIQALNSWVDQQQNQNVRSQMQGVQNPPGLANQQQQQPNMPPGVRTPSGPGQPGAPQFMSPAMANSLIPNAVNGSPHLMQHHTPSPASHPMVAQHSQQGTSSSATASVNTSPNVSQKRRRSTAKGDPNDDGDVNGAVKVKQSPRVGGNKRVKQNN